MATRKKTAAAKASAPSLLQKISQKASQLKDTLIHEKDQVVRAATETVESIKEKIQKVRNKKSASPKKSQPRTKVAIAAPKKAVKKDIPHKKKTVKKAVPAKKKR